MTAESPDAISDDAMWVLLRQHVAERAPEDVRAAAKRALDWRDADGALARLVSDSAEPRVGEPTGVRGPGGSRLLAFATADLSIDVEASWRDGTASLIGQIAPVGPAAIEVDHPAGRAATHADDLGRFSVDGIEPGQVRLRCTPDATGTPVRTEWIRL